jgi:hypothetical protein
MEMEAHNLPVGVIASSVDMGQAVIDDAPIRVWSIRKDFHGS